MLENKLWSTSGMTQGVLLSVSLVLVCLWDRFDDKLEGYLGQWILDALLQGNGMRGHRCTNFQELHYTICVHSCMLCHEVPGDKRL